MNSTTDKPQTKVETTLKSNPFTYKLLHTIRQELVSLNEQGTDSPLAINKSVIQECVKGEINYYVEHGTPGVLYECAINKRSSTPYFTGIIRVYSFYADGHPAYQEDYEELTADEVEDRISNQDYECDTSIEGPFTQLCPLSQRLYEWLGKRGFRIVLRYAQNRVAADVLYYAPCFHDYISFSLDSFTYDQIVSYLKTVDINHEVFQYTKCWRDSSCFSVRNTLKAYDDWANILYKALRDFARREQMNVTFSEPTKY